MKMKKQNKCIECGKELPDSETGLCYDCCEKVEDKPKKYLYCETCLKCPDKIKERYLEPIVEVRKWDVDSGCYGLESTNMEDVEFEQLCGECDTKLIEK
jgi:hypothetical protein